MFQRESQSWSSNITWCLLVFLFIFHVECQFLSISIQIENYLISAFSEAKMYKKKNAREKRKIDEKGKFDWDLRHKNKYTIVGCNRKKSWWFAYKIKAISNGKIKLRSVSALLWHLISPMRCVNLIQFSWWWKFIKIMKTNTTTKNSNEKKKKKNLNVPSGGSCWIKMNVVVVVECHA